MHPLRIAGQDASRVAGTSALVLTPGPSGPPAPVRRRGHLALIPAGVDVAPRALVARPPEPVTRQAGPGRLRLTARGRAAGWVLVVSALAGLVVALSGFLRDPAADVPPRPAGPMIPASARTVVVGTGETLWSVAVRVAPQADPRDEVEALRALNGLATSSVQVGQVLRIPGR